MRPVIVVALLAPLVAGCAPTAPASAPPTPASAPPAASAPPPVPAAPPPSTSTAAVAAERCRLADLGAELAAPEGAAAGRGERTVRVVWTNTSSRPCTMTGFGGVDVQRASSDRAGSEERGRPNSFSVPRNGAATTTVRLGPGEKAHSTIGYLSDRYSVDDFYAETILATPPDETHAAILRWNGDIVLRGRTILEPVAAGAR